MSNNWISSLEIWDVVYNWVKFPNNENTDILYESKYLDFWEPDYLEKKFIEKIYELYWQNKRENLKSKINNLNIKNPLWSFAVNKIKKILPEDKLERLKKSIKFYPDRVELIVWYDERKIVIDKKNTYIEKHKIQIAWKEKVIKDEKLYPEEWNFFEMNNYRKNMQPLSYQDIQDINDLLWEELTLKDLLPSLIKENAFYWTSSWYDSSEKPKYYFDSNWKLLHQPPTIRLRAIYKIKKSRNN